MEKFVSICIPAYNNADYIGETIESILGQTHRNLELVIVDDNSTDDTLRVIQEYAKTDDRVRVYHNDVNRGMAGNWSYSLSLCRGEYLKLCCADDLLAPNAIAREVEILDANPEAVDVCSDTKLVALDGSDKGFYKRYFKHGLVSGNEVAKFGFFTSDQYGAPQANTFRREAYERVGGYSPEYTYIVDYEFLIRLTRNRKIYINHEPLNYFRVRNESNTGQVMGGDKEKKAVYVGEHERLFRENRQDLKLREWQIRLAVAIREFRCFAARIYLMLFVRE